MIRTSRLALATAVCMALLPSAANAVSLTFCPAGGPCTLGALNRLPANIGEMIEIEVVLDTEGLGDFKGYGYGVDIIDGSASGITLTHEPLAGFMPDLLGTPVIDVGSDTIRNVNQVELSPDPGLPAGVYTLDTIRFVAGSVGNLLVTGGLYGESFGLAGGACPGTVPRCAVDFFPILITPEPSTALLLGSALLLLSVRRGHTRTRRAARPGPASSWLRRASR